MFIALLICISLIVAELCLIVWLLFILRQAKAERDEYQWQYQEYMNKMSPVIHYLADHHWAGEEVTHDGLRTTFRMLGMDYDEWIEDLPQ
jgi:hypothetical protein